MKLAKPKPTEIMMNMLLIFSLFIFPSFSASLGVVSNEYDYHSSQEYQTILAQLKLLGDFESTKLPLDMPPSDKKMSRGEQVVAAAKAKNKALIAEQNLNEVNKKKSPLSDLGQLKIEDQKIREGWKKEVLEQRKQWQKEQEIFLGRLKIYKENTFEIPAPKTLIIEKKIPSDLPQIHIINQAFHPEIRDQFSRPTCSAFAGVRALEIILAQNKIHKDLSEQYFYWASKPNCQNSPCTEKGSWVNSALRFSQKQGLTDIPLESNCSYAPESLVKNETQLPLPGPCLVGDVKVETFEDVRTLADVTVKLRANIPVIMAARLSDNFYKNSGFVTLAEAEKNSSTRLDDHALGHAFLAIGLIELPKKIKLQEGDFCILIANSWGKGWGAGGYSCLSENWLKKFRQPAPFVAVTKVFVK